MSDITNKFLPDLGTIKKDLKQNGACKWNVNESGIKIFFDVTGIGEMARLGSSKSTFGVGISLTAMVTNKVLNSVNHVGFILSDGTIIHATTNRGVIRESGKGIINDTKNYVVANVGGNESDLISKYNQLKKTLYIDKDSYDWKGIVRQVPLIGKLLGRLNFARENKPYRFYCSELVANLLVRCGVISYNELVSLNEKTVGLDKYDEVDPTKLFLMIKSKAKLCPVVCDTDKDLKKENTMTKNELKQLIKEVLVEQNALTTLQISTVGGGTTLLLYKGDAKGSEVSSDKHYKTPTKFKDLIASLNTTGGMTSDESIKKILKKLTPAQLKELVREKIVVSDKVSEFLGEEASTKELQKLGFKPTKSDVNESPIVRGLIRPDPKSPLEGAVVKRVESHGHYHADMILLTKNNKEIKGRFEFDPHNPPSFYESVNEAGGYEDGIKDAKDRMKYVALRKMEKDHLAKSKITKDIKKQHHLDMADKYLDQALAIAKKHGVVDEGKMNEVQGYVFGPMETPNNWISTNAKPKMKNGTKTWVVSAVDFQKAFPNIQMKQLPTNPSKYSNYYMVDNEGDLIAYSQANVGSSLD